MWSYNICNLSVYFTIFSHISNFSWHSDGKCSNIDQVPMLYFDWWCLCKDSGSMIHTHQEKNHNSKIHKVSFRQFIELILLGYTYIGMNVALTPNTLASSKTTTAWKKISYKMYLTAKLLVSCFMSTFFTWHSNSIELI